MVFTLPRRFQPSSGSNQEHSRLPIEELEAPSSKPSSASTSALRLTLETRHSNSAPLLGRYHHSSISLGSGSDTPRAGPSHVSWKTPDSNSPRQSIQESPASARTPSPMWGGTPGQAQGRFSLTLTSSGSASSPSLLVSPPSTASTSQTYTGRPSSMGKRSSLSMGFTADSANASEDSDGDSMRSTRSQNVPKPLSPIHEVQHVPPQRKVSLDSVPRTPDSTRTFDRIGSPSPSPVHSAFINRPLKRSPSQTSTSTFRSNVSTQPAAPAIPPLDLRPNFQNAMNAPHSPAVAPTPRKSRLVGPTLPTVIGSPRQTNKVSVIYEDGGSARTSSFITAPSLNTPDVTEPDPPVFIARDYAASAGTDGTDTEETEETQRGNRNSRPRQIPLPEGLYSIDRRESEDGVRPTSRSALRPSTPTPSPSQPASLATPRRSLDTRRSFYSRSASLASTRTSESFLQRRWLRGMSFGEERFVFPPTPERKLSASHACILFWVGFVAPWCWLIGGWLLTTAGEVGSDGLYAETGPVLPLWHKLRKGGRQNTREANHAKERAAGADPHHEDAGVPMPERVKAISGAAERRIKTKSWYPLLAPSLESLTPSTGSGTSARKLKRCLPTSSAVDPWVHRCRIAAATSGLLIFIAFVIAIVLVAGVRM
ncbi:hypothetical protein C8Q78DRAFT_1077855 [Trametes maxima]|nr:hypothetical protein C8Q78DRAFT_1077855 [Trametes maxima]